MLPFLAAAKLAGMQIPNMSAANVEHLKALMIKIHGLLRECNQYVRDFKTIADMYYSDPLSISNHVLVINPIPLMLEALFSGFTVTLLSSSFKVFKSFQKCPLTPKRGFT
jgi:hypothetical protein